MCTRSGLLVFKHGEAEKDITIEIIDDEVRVRVRVKVRVGVKVQALGLRVGAKG